MYLLHGENFYLSWQELVRLKQEILNKDRNIEFVILDSEEIEPSKLQFTTTSMFSKKNFYIFKRFFSLPKERREQVWGEILQLKIVDIIFWEDRQADKRSKIYKDFSKIAVVREFAILREADMNYWIRKELEKRAIKFDHDLVNELYFRFGDNQFLIESELDKLKVYLEIRGKDDVDVIDYEVLSGGMVHSNWELIELIFLKRKKEAIAYLNSFSLEIDEQKMIIGGLASTLRNTYLAKIYSPDNLKPIGAKLKINPYALKRGFEYSRNFTKERLEKLYEQLMNFDYALNLSRIDFKVGMILLIVSL
ncbi:hypothetical protein KBD45_02075 [Candidatus Dojkabacteria bacterium]|nr:hypothetical protein [Candidatus Dojkabacteria bacterium]